MSVPRDFAPFYRAASNALNWFNAWPEHDKLEYQYEYESQCAQIQQRQNGPPSVSQMVDIITDLNGRLFEGGFSNVNSHKDAEGTLANPKAEDGPMKPNTESANSETKVDGEQSTHGFSEPKGIAKHECGGHAQGGSETAPSGHNVYKSSGHYIDGSTGDTKDCSELSFPCFVDETSQFTLTHKRF